VTAPNNESPMAHDHDHGHHDHADHDHASTFGRACAIGIFLNGGFIVAEVIFGLASHSLSLIADAAHNLGDVLSLLMVWGAMSLGRRLPTRERTYGYGRSSILASLANAVILLIGVGAIAFEAVRRFGDLQPVAETTVVWVALAGIAVNGGTALLFMSGRKTDLNVKGAFLHMASDAVVSLGVVVSALLIGWTGWLWLDPLTSLAIVTVITIGTWSLLRDSVNLAMDAVPARIDRQAVEAHLKELSGVAAVHDLHIWPLSTTETALTAHLAVEAGVINDDLIACAVQTMKQNFGIGHATFQLETIGAAQTCALAPDHVI
jgi:cobalt-zinc-cadmium efflux system protein